MREGPLPLLYDVTPGRDAERRFFVDSWRRSLQDAPAYAGIPTRGYVAFATDVIEHFLGEDDGFIALDKRDRLYVARDRERTSYLYGWLLCRDMQPGLAVVYVYTKSVHRRHRVASDLLASAVEASSDGPLSYSFHTRMDPWFQSLGFAYVPVEKLEFDVGAVEEPVLDLSEAVR